MGKGNRIVLLTLLATILLVSTATAVAYTNAEPIAKLQKIKEDYTSKIEIIKETFSFFNTSSLSKKTQFQQKQNEKTLQLTDLKNSFLKENISQEDIEELLENLPLTDSRNNNSNVTFWQGLWNFFLLVIVLLSCCAANILSMAVFCKLLTFIWSFACLNNPTCAILVFASFAELVPSVFILISMISSLLMFFMSPILLALNVFVSDNERREELTTLLGSVFTTLLLYNPPTLVFGMLFFISAIIYIFVTTGYPIDVSLHLNYYVNFFFSFVLSYLESCENPFQKNFLTELRTRLNETNPSI